MIETSPKQIRSYLLRHSVKHPMTLTAAIAMGAGIIALPIFGGWVPLVFAMGGAGVAVGNILLNLTMNRQYLVGQHMRLLARQAEMERREKLGHIRGVLFDLAQTS